MTAGGQSISTTASKEKRVGGTQGPSVSSWHSWGLGTRSRFAREAQFTAVTLQGFITEISVLKSSSSSGQLMNREAVFNSSSGTGSVTYLENWQRGEEAACRHPGFLSRPDRSAAHVGLSSSVRLHVTLAQAHVAQE